MKLLALLSVIGAFTGKSARADCEKISNEKGQSYVQKYCANESFSSMLKYGSLVTSARDACQAYYAQVVTSLNVICDYEADAVQFAKDHQDLIAGADGASHVFKNTAQYNQAAMAKHLEWKVKLGHEFGAVGSKFRSYRGTLTNLINHGEDLLESEALNYGTCGTPGSPSSPNFFGLAFSVMDPAELTEKGALKLLLALIRRNEAGTMTEDMASNWATGEGTQIHSVMPAEKAKRDTPYIPASAEDNPHLAAANDALQGGSTKAVELALPEMMGKGYGFAGAGAALDALQRYSDHGRLGASDYFFIGVRVIVTGVAGAAAPETFGASVAAEVAADAGLTYLEAVVKHVLNKVRDKKVDAYLQVLNQHKDDPAVKESSVVAARTFRMAPGMPGAPRVTPRGGTASVVNPEWYSACRQGS